ncbi:LysR family transcriptional regulator [Solimonas variicoloris]|uniref:LysR family transcriptional regulator n=1 Tax=Solimonas variicoloris TaxID=254408 RepID=UPI0003604CD6|nr:LysR family transcriptional regulator [Solimonas variicoloris]
MPIDDLASLRVYAAVVSAGSLSAAARALDLSLPQVSKRLAQLEAALGTRLIQRTTRRQTLTADGERFHAQVVQILAAVELAEQQMAGSRQRVDGLLRVTAPGAFGRQRVAPLLAEFQRRHPQLRVQLDLSDAVRDLIEAGLDVAIRFGRLADSSLVARELAPNFRVLCASPAYLAEHGVPAHPADLLHHRCILIGEQSRSEWRFGDGEAQSVRVEAALLTNDGGAAHAWALDGAGIALKSIWDVADDLRSGRLQRVLPDQRIPAAPLHAIYPHARLLAPRVRLFVDFLGERLRQIWQGLTA